MLSFINTTSKPVHLVLAKDRVRSIKRGHPWLFPEVLVDLPSAPAGSMALVKDRPNGEILAKGFYDPGSRLAFRTVALRERLDDALIESRLQRALQLRRHLFPDPSVTSGFRLLNGEGDGLPGLVIDIYGDTAVIKLDGAGPSGFYRLDAVAQWLQSNFELRTVYLKHRAKAGGGGKDTKSTRGGASGGGVQIQQDGGDEEEDVQQSGGQEERGQLVAGQYPDAPVLFRENGLLFQADVVLGQKTGFFLDQRDNRQRLGQCATGAATVLNVFGYTGGFSIACGATGAGHVTTVDLAAPALQFAEANWALNGLPASAHVTVAADAFVFLEQAVAARRRWDVVVVDPPSFAPSKVFVERACASYARIFTLAAQVTAENGLLALSSCSSHISEPMFLELCEEAMAKARRQGYVLRVAGQPEDHPYPVACDELRYLKFALYRLEG